LAPLLPLLLALLLARMFALLTLIAATSAIIADVALS
jgi:hypothetical protein